MFKRNLQPCVTWVDTLALRPTDLSPATYTALQKHLATCPACATAFADYQELHTRLRALPHPATQASPFRWTELDEQAHEETAGTTASPESLVFPTLLPRRSYQQRLTAFATVLVVALLIGTSTLLFVRLHMGNTRSTAVSALRAGWQQVALYSGTGSKTIAISDVQLPVVWGDGYSCQGGGSLQIKMTTVYSDGHQGNLHTGSDHCPFTVDLAPSGVSLDALPQSVQTIVVTAPASTTWAFQLLTEVSSPVFPLNAQWVSQMGMGGQASSAGNVPPAEVNGQTLHPRQWAVAMVCFGTGRGSVTLTPDVGIGKIAFPPCNGQVGSHVLTFPQANQIQEVQVEISGHLLWSINLLFCGTTDGLLCQ